MTEFVPPPGLADSELRGQTVWIIGINYAPDNVGIAPYTAQLAEYLHHRGAHVEVTTGVPHYPEWKIADGYTWMLSARERVNGVRVQRLRHTVPHHMTALRRGLYEATFLAHALLRRPPCLPDVIIGVTPALSGALAAARLSKRLGVPYMIIVQDLVGPGALQSGIEGGEAVAGIAGKAEAWALRGASAVTVLHEGFKPYVLEAGVPADRVHIVRNWSYAVPATLTQEEARHQLAWPTDRPVVLYAGNMGKKMYLWNMVKAAKLAQERGDDILFVLLGDGHRRHDLEERSHGVTTIRFEDSRYGPDFANALVAADILVVNERPGVKNMSLPSKLAYYFTSARPVLAAVEEGGTTALEVTEAGAGVVVPAGEPQQLLDAALAIAGDAEGSRAMGEAGQKFAATEYDRVHILQRVEGILANVLAGGTVKRRRASRH